MELKNRVSITVPSTMGLDTPIDNTDFAMGVAKKLALMFGGFRIVDNITGGYVADNGELVVEPNKDVIAYCETLKDEQVEEIVKIALELKEEMKQESILYEINGVAYMI